MHQHQSQLGLADARVPAHGVAQEVVHARDFLSQSGALGIAVMSQAAQLGLGLSTFASVGNKADVSGNDLLCYWDEDPRTDVIMLYLESFGNPKRFGRLARRIGRTKPIVAVKSGRSVAGARAASSHTGSLLASSDSTVDAMFRQHGVIRTDTLEEMFDVGTLLANQPVPDGDRVAIVTNAGGLGILCADTCEARGLSVPELGEATVTELTSFLPEQASATNPVDMIASASGEDYGRTIRTVAADPGIDSLIVIYIPPLEDSAHEVARHMVESIGSIERRIRCSRASCRHAASRSPSGRPASRSPPTPTPSRPRSRSRTRSSWASGGRSRTANPGDRRGPRGRGRRGARRGARARRGMADPRRGRGSCSTATGCRPFRRRGPRRRRRPRRPRSRSTAASP